jgi:hypothetical protein
MFAKELCFASGKDDFKKFWSVDDGVKIEAAGEDVVLFGKPLVFRHDFYSASCLNNLLMEMTFIPSPGPIFLDLAPYYIALDDTHHHSAISRTVGGNFLAHSDRLRIAGGESNTLKITYAAGRLEIVLNGESLVFSSEYAPTINNIALTGFGEIQISNLMVMGSSESLIPLSPSKNFDFDMTFDFGDDIIPAPYTKAMLSQMMSILKANGFRRINWIYYGGRSEGFWDSIADTFIPAKYLKETFEHLGDDFLVPAVEAAHQAGLEIYAIFKPFDMSICGLNMPLGSETKFPFVRNDILGGKAYACYDFAANYPELCMRRRRTAPAKRSISKIVITTRNDSASLSGELEIWCSENNWKYTPYDGPHQISYQGNQITISGMKLTSPFVAIQLKNQNDGKNIFNTLAELISVFDDKNERISFTYGLNPRTYRRFSGTHLERSEDKGGGFREEGLLFDYQNGIPTAVWNAEEISHRYFDFKTNEEGVIGIALGQNDFVPGCMSPAEPEAVNYWLKIIQRALNHGVDGIDLRVINHCNVLSWSEYGFNEPAVKEYKKRFGIDVRSEEFDRKVWRQLQGEYYTNFLKQAKQVVHAKGKKFRLHIEDMMEGTPDASTPMNIEWNWQGWLEEGIPDEVTYKALSVDSYRSNMGRTLLTACNEKGIPVYYSPFIHSLLEQKTEAWKTCIVDMRRSGMSGLTVYENATIYKSRPDGSIENLYPDLIHYIQTVH